jgi:peroxiredoxin
MKTTLINTPSQNCHFFIGGHCTIGKRQPITGPAAPTSPARYNLWVQINEPAPDFALPDLKGELVQLSRLRGKIVILNFWSCECPHSDRTDRQLMAMCVQWGDDVVMLPIASNRIESIEAIEQAALARHLPTVLLDAEHRVADLYAAQTTPHVFLIGPDGMLRYAGAMDDVSFRQKRPTRFYLDEAVEALLAGRLPEVAEIPAYGCSIVREALE